MHRASACCVSVALSKYSQWTMHFCSTFNQKSLTCHACSKLVEQQCIRLSVRSTIRLTVHPSICPGCNSSCVYQTKWLVTWPTPAQLSRLSNQWCHWTFVTERAIHNSTELTDILFIYIWLIFFYITCKYKFNILYMLSCYLWFYV